MEGPKSAHPQDPQVLQTEKICGIFMHAEEVAKKIERIDDGMIVPAINQLRYAGHHFVKFSAGIEPEEAHDDKCINHCRRAIYDAYEAGITYCLLQLRAFQNDYRKAVITEVFTDYSECCSKANEANDLVKTTDSDQRQKKSDQAEEYFDKIFAFTQRLPVIRDELNKKVRKDRRNFHIVFATLLVTCVILGYTIWKDGFLTSLRTNTEAKPDLLEKQDPSSLKKNKPSAIINSSKETSPLSGYQYGAF